MYRWQTSLTRVPGTWINRLYDAIVNWPRGILFDLGCLAAGGLALITGNGSYLRVGRYFAWLAADNPLDSASTGQNIFAIQGGVLRRRSHGPMKLPDLDLTLNETQMKVLRAAYWPITEARLQDLSDEKTPLPDILAAVAHLEDIRAIVRDSNKIVSVVNDREYWIANGGSKTAVAGAITHSQKRSEAYASTLSAQSRDANAAFGNW